MLLRVWRVLWVLADGVLMEVVCFGMAWNLAGEVLLGDRNALVFAGAVVVLQCLWEVISRWTFSTEFASFHSK